MHMPQTNLRISRPLWHLVLQVVCPPSSSGCGVNERHLEKMFASGTIDMTLAGDGAEVARARRAGLRQKPQSTGKGQQLLPSWGLGRGERTDRRGCCCYLEARWG